VPVIDEYGQTVARVDLGWPGLNIAVEYDGDHHWTDRRQLAYDFRRGELLKSLGWIVVRVTAEDSPATILHRIATVLAERGAGVRPR
jgi:very-short-patch-repair endonuclease